MPKRKKVKPSKATGKKLAKIKKVLGQALKKNIFGASAPEPVETTSIAHQPEPTPEMVEIDLTDKLKGIAPPLYIDPAMKEGFLNAAQEALIPQVGVPTISTPVGSGPSKKLHPGIKVALKKAKALTGMEDAEKAELIDAVTKASNEIFENTVKSPANFVHFGPEVIQAVATAMKIPVEYLEGMAPPAEGALAEAAGAVTMTMTMKVAESAQVYLMLVDPAVDHATMLLLEAQVLNTPVPSVMVEGAASPVIKACKEAHIHCDLMLHALEGSPVQGLVEEAPKRYAKEEAEDYRARLRVWWEFAHKAFLVNAKVARGEGHQPYIPLYTTPPVVKTTEEFLAVFGEPNKNANAYAIQQKAAADAMQGMSEKDVQAGHVFSPYTPWYTTPPILLTAFKVLQWMEACAAEALHIASGPPLDMATFLIVRNWIVEKFVSTFEPALPVQATSDPEYSKAYVVYRTALRFNHRLEQVQGPLTPKQVKVFNAAFPKPEGFGEKPPLGYAHEDFEAMQEQAKACVDQPINFYAPAGLVKKLDGPDVNDFLQVHAEHPGTIPEVDVSLVVEDGQVFIKHTANGEVISKKPYQVTPEVEVSPKALATLNRFGAVLKSTG